MAFIDIDVTKNIKTIDCWMQGEKNAEGVHFDISTWIETYGAGTAYIYIRRNGDETAYFRAMEVTDGVAEWLFSAADTAKAGDGRAQAVYITTDESVVKKTNWYHTVTAESEGDPTGEDPDPYKEMATEVIARMEDAEEELTEEALGEISDAKDAALEDIQDTMFNLAPEFVTTASYSAGDIVLYIGNLYEFTADHAAGAWIGTDVRQITIGGVVADLKEEINDKPNWTVGSAEQLVSDEASATDVTPYTFRRSGGGLIPFNFTREELAKVVGGTVAWNQLVNTYNTSETTKDGLTKSVVTDSGRSRVHIQGTYGTPSADPNIYSVVNSRTVINGHIYLFASSSPLFGVIPYNGLTAANNARGSERIARGTADRTDGAVGLVPMVTQGTSVNTNLDIIMTDLTALFSNPAIADYVYSLEQATAGAGVAWLKEHFPKMFNSGYMAYDSGTLKSVDGLQSHDTTGKNLIPLNATSATVSGVTFTVNDDGSVTANGTATANAGFQLYAGANNTFDLANGDYILTGCPTGGGSQTYRIWIDNRTSAGTGSIESKADAGAGQTITITEGKCRVYVFITNGQTVNNLVFKPMLRLSSVSDATFEPYQKHTYALDSDLVLRGRFYLDSNNNLRADGDVYLPSGDVSRRYAEVDIGSLNWTYNTGYQTPVFSAQLSTFGGKSRTSNVGAVGYITKDFFWETADNDKCIGCGASYLNVSNSAYTDAASFKTAMNGVKMVCELATPTTETADPYTAVQICDSDGTEEFVDALVEAGTRDVAIPAGTETVYYEDMASKLAELPPIPSAPSANGTYTLQAVVSGGTVTYQWTS